MNERETKVMRGRSRAFWRRLNNARLRKLRRRFASYFKTSESEVVELAKLARRWQLSQSAEDAIAVCDAMCAVEKTAVWSQQHCSAESQHGRRKDER